MMIQVGNKYRVDLATGTVVAWDAIANHYTTTLPVSEGQRRWAVGQARAQVADRTSGTELHALGYEAAAAGDLKQVVLVQRALRGDRSSVVACALAIEAGRG